MGGYNFQIWSNLWLKSHKIIALAYWKTATYVVGCFQQKIHSQWLIWLNVSLIYSDFLMNCLETNTESIQGNTFVKHIRNQPDPMKVFTINIKVLSFSCHIIQQQKSSGVELEFYSNMLLSAIFFNMDQVQYFTFFLGCSSSGRNGGKWTWKKVCWI